MGGAARVALRGFRAGRRGGRVDRSGPPRPPARRAPGGGEGAVPGDRRRAGGRPRHGGRRRDRPDPAGQGDDARPRAEAAAGRAARAHARGGGRGGGGPAAALLRPPLPRPSVRLRAARDRRPVPPPGARLRMGRRRRLRRHPAPAAARARPDRRDPPALLPRVDRPRGPVQHRSAPGQLHAAGGRQDGLPRLRQRQDGRSGLAGDLAGDHPGRRRARHGGLHGGTRGAWLRSSRGPGRRRAIARAVPRRRRLVPARPRGPDRSRVRGGDHREAGRPARGRILAADGPRVEDPARGDLVPPRADRRPRRRGPAPRPRQLAPRDARVRVRRRAVDGARAPGVGVLRARRPGWSVESRDMTEDDGRLLSTRGIVLNALVYVVKARFDHTWGRGIHLVYTAAAAAFVIVMAARTPVEGERPRDWQSILYVAAYLLALVTLLRLADVFGVHDI